MSTDSEKLEQEVARLRAENAALNQQLASARGQRRAIGWRRFGMVVFLILGVLLMPLSVTAVWANNTIANTSNYTDTVAPLVDDPDVQEAVSKRVADELFAQIDVAAEVQAALPPNAQFLAGPLTAQLKTVVQQTVKTAMGTDQFQQAWIAANRTAHDQVVSVLLNKKSALQTQGDTVTLDLRALAIQTRDELSKSGMTIFDKLPAEKVTGSVVLLDSPDIGMASSALRLLNMLRWVLPVLALVSFALAFWLAPSRRNAVVAAALAIAAVMALYLIALKVGHDIFTTETARAADISRDAASALYDTITRFLSRSVEAILTLGIVVAILAFFTGPYTLSMRIRTSISNFSNQRKLGEVGKVSAFVQSYKVALRLAAIGIPVVLLLLWNRPTPVVVVVMAVFALVLLFAIELLAPSKTTTQTG